MLMESSLASQVLERGMALARDRAPGKASSLLRLCGIWQERQVFKPDYCDQLRRIVNGEAAPAAAAPPGSPQTPPISPIVSSPPASPSVSAAAPSSPASARAGRPEPVAVDDAGASVVAAGDADADAEADMASSSATLSSSIARVQELSGSTAKQLSEVLRLSANTPGLLDGTCALPATRAGLVQLQAQAKQAEAAVAELRRLLRREVAQRSNLVLLLQAAATEQVRARLLAAHLPGYVGCRGHALLIAARGVAVRAGGGAGCCRAAVGAVPTR